MAIGTVSDKGWIVIPKELRDRYGWTKGTKVVVVDDGQGVYITSVSADPIGSARGMFKGGPSLTEALLANRRAEREREEAREREWHAARAKASEPRGRVRS